MTLGNKHKLAISLAASFSLIGTLFFFGPIQIYYKNILEVNFSGNLMLLEAITITTITTSILSLILYKAKESVHKPAISMILCLSLILWLEGNVLPWSDQMILDGQASADFSTSVKFFDAALWLIFIILPFFFYKKIYPHAKGISTIVVLTQLISGFILFINSPNEPYYKDFVPNEANAFELSEKENTIIFLLDEFQSTIFDEIISTNPELKGEFEDFTFYKNTTSGYPTTRASLMSIFTERYYENEIPAADFLEKYYLTSSYFQGLREKNCEIYIRNAFDGTATYNNELFTDSEKIKFFEKALKTLMPIVEIRYAPVFLKQTKAKMALENKDFAYIARLNEELNINQNLPCTFKFYHLFGMHPPLAYDENLKQKNIIEGTREDYVSQAKGLLKEMGKIVSLLKSNGIYDQSTIVVMADHGAGIPNENYAKSKKDIIPSGHYFASPHGFGSGLPLLLVKKQGEKGEFQVSETPVSLPDLLSIIRGDFVPRESRYFYDYTWGEKGWSTEYMPTLTKFEIKGDATNPASWKKTNEEFLEGEKITKQIPLYTLGDEIKFGRNEKDYYLMEGWQSPEDGYRWTTEIATISLQLKGPPDGKGLILSATFFPFVAQGKLDNQIVDVYVNDEKVGQWIAARENSYQLLIPTGDYADSSVIQLAFVLPTAISPRELGISEDPRALGIAMRSLSISEAEEYKYGKTIDFATNNDLKRYIYSGFGTTENGFTWTVDKTVNIQLPVSLPTSDLTLSTSFFPLVAEGKLDQQVIDVYVNDKKIGQWMASKEDVYKLNIPQAYITSSVINLRFQIPMTTTPMALGMNEDRRTLGIAVKSLSISEIKK